MRLSLPIKMFNVWVSCHIKCHLCITCRLEVQCARARVCAWVCVCVCVCQSSYTISNVWIIPISNVQCTCQFPCQLSNECFSSHLKCVMHVSGTISNIQYTCQFPSQMSNARVSYHLKRPTHVSIPISNAQCMCKFPSKMPYKLASSQQKCCNICVPSPKKCLIRL